MRRGEHCRTWGREPAARERQLGVAGGEPKTDTGAALSAQARGVRSEQEETKIRKKGFERVKTVKFWGQEHGPLKII